MPWCMGRIPEEYGIVVVFIMHVCVCLCVILQHTFLRDRHKLSNENCNATATRHSATAKLTRFLF